MTEVFKVSIIIPVYNAATYLDDCVGSVVSQTYKNIEIILVDDSSTDDSAAMCDAWSKKDSRILVKRQSNNQGAACARNAGIEAASGDYIMFVDSDDAVSNEIVKAMCSFDPADNIDIVICGTVWKNRIREKKQKWLSENTKLSNSDLMRAYASGHISTALWGKLFIRRVFQTHRLPTIRKCEDAMIMHELLGECKTAYLVKQYLYFQNTRAGSLENSAMSRNDLYGLEAVFAMRKYYFENYPELHCCVLGKPVSEIFVLLKRMYFLRCVKSKNDIYRHLMNTLIKERDILAVYPEHHSLVHKIDFLLLHPSISSIFLKAEGCIRRIYYSIGIGDPPCEKNR